MTEDFPVAHAIEPLLVLNVQTKAVRSLTGTPLGDRMVFDAVSGTFAGPRLKGRVLPTGGDWVARTPTGSRLNVRLVLETDDGIDILFEYSGRACQTASRVRIDVAGTFDAPAGAYGWLNDVQTFGCGAHGPDGVCYYFYRFE